jgi:uncharacterized protein with ATP-grasp and redox domains
VIDFGIFTSIDIEGAVRKAFNPHIAVDDFNAFKEAVLKSDEILYLTDNAGEIVFDRLLIETLRRLGKKVKAVVKGAPVLNDSTMDDAEETGLAAVCEVIDNGSDAGNHVTDFPAFSNLSYCRLVISKGQGNFETLAGNEKTLFFLFQSKCDVVSKELRLSNGSMLLKKS